MNDSQEEKEGAAMGIDYDENETRKPKGKKKMSDDYQKRQMGREALHSTALPGFPDEEEKNPPLKMKPETDNTELDLAAGFGRLRAALLAIVQTSNEPLTRRIAQATLDGADLRDAETCRDVFCGQWRKS
jgi:hypothetical protein